MDDPGLPGGRFKGGSPPKGLLAAIVVANLFVIALVGAVIVRERQHAFDKVAVVAENYCRTLEQSLTGLVGRVDATLMTTADEVTRQRAEGGINREKLNAFLARQDSHIPDTRGLRVTDELGYVRYAVTGVVIQGANLGDRPYFITVRDDPNAGLVVSEPVMGRVSDQWVVTLSRRIGNPDGSFGGEVNAAVATQRFEDMLAAIDSGSLGSASLWTRTQLIARHTQNATGGAKPGTPVPSPQLRALIESGEKTGWYHAVTPLDGVRRFYQFRQVGGFPLYVVVGLADADFLSEWRRDSLRLAGMAVLFCLGSAFFTAVIWASWRRRETSEEELRSTAARLSLVLETAAEGIIGLNTEWRVIFATPRRRRDPGLVIGRGDEK